MSTERNPIVSTYSNDVHVTSFSGGQVRGRCLQLTQSVKLGAQLNGNSYIQVDKDQAELLIEELTNWLAGR